MDLRKSLLPLYIDFTIRSFDRRDCARHVYIYTRTSTISLAVMFYYLLHHGLPESERFTEGRRNCATFLYGSLLYCIVYVVVMNVRLRYGECMDSVRSALLMAWLADCAAVGFLYKSHYGRSLLHEVVEVAGGEDRAGWVFDEESRTYRRPTAADAIRRNDGEARLVEAEVRRIADAQMAAQRTERVSAIDLHKKRVRAARVIQRWWRSVLYTPPNGIMYNRAMADFKANAAS